MKRFGFKATKNFSNDLVKTTILFSIASIILSAQNSAFLFNPFILVLLSGSYVISFSSLVCVSVLTIITSFIIEIEYGIEMSIICFLFVVFFFVSKIINDKKIKIFFPMISVNLILFLIYFFTSNDEFYRINSLVLSFFSVLFSFVLIDIIHKYTNKEEVSSISLGLMMGMVSVLLVKYDKITYLFITFILLAIYRVERKELYFVSCFSSLINLYLFSNTSINLLFAFYISLFLIGLVNTKYSYFLFVPFSSLMLLSVNNKFYLDNFYYQILLGFLLMCLIPNSFLIKVKNLVNYSPQDSLSEIIEYQKNKLNQISNLCTLLMDDRFDKYDELDIQLEKLIKKEVCNKCSNKSVCRIDLSSYLTGHLSNNEKATINSNCIYPYQITKSINNMNKRIQDYSERELKSVESRKIMNNAYQRIKDCIDSNPDFSSKEIKYKITFEVLSSKAVDSPNGDSYNLNETKNDALLVLADGMGHNSKSKDISEYLIELINYLHVSSKNMSNTIESANSILLAKTYEEVYSTLDVAKFDLESGKMELFKAGSFPTYIIRNKVVKEVSTKLPPIGIINNIHIDPEEIELRNNDIILFMTDGFGENVSEAINKTTQKASFLPFKNYVKFLFNTFTKSNNTDDDKTLIAIKINKI